MADAGFDGGASLQVKLDRLGDAWSLTGDVNPQLLVGRRIVAAVSPVGYDFRRLLASQAAFLRLRIAAAWESDR